MALEPIYDPEAVAPLWQELVAVGVEPHKHPVLVDEVLRAPKGTVLLVVNSICGCAAGQARPGVMLALQNDVIPDRSVTVFAGVDRDAVNRAREHMPAYPPSSPAVALFKDGQQVFMLQRADLQRLNEDGVAAALKQAFADHCAKAGPSIDPETFRQLRPHQGCGSQIPLARLS
jgi:putative YphP/YqiW family bacilliredoxin